MKKFIALTIGLSLLGSALIIPFSNASREAYHSYISQKVRESGRYRHSTDYKGQYRPMKLSNRLFVNESTNVAGRNYRKSLLPKNKRNIYSSHSSNRNLTLRTSTNRITRSIANNSHRISISTNGMLDTAHFLFKNYTNESFSLEIPETSILNNENNVAEVKIPKSSIKLTVKKLDSTCPKNFLLCAKAVSRTLDREYSIYRTSKTVQQYQKTDAILGSVGLDSKKYVEGFVGETMGNLSFVARFITKGENGELFLIKASSNLKDIDKTVVFAKKAFETFRAKY